MNLPHRLRRLRVAVHFLPSGWVFEIAALIAAVAWLAELVERSPK